MDMKKQISISTQNKLILLGLVVSTILIVSLAVFAITNIQQKISEVYDDFGRWATSKGYDAYVNHDDRFTEYIVLNRSILKVKR